MPPTRAESVRSGQREWRAVLLRACSMDWKRAVTSGRRGGMVGSSEAIVRLGGWVLSGDWVVVWERGTIEGQGGASCFAFAFALSN